MLQRVIGQFNGRKNGPLVLVFAGMHGNETAGIVAVEKVFQLLRTNFPGGENNFSGNLLALRGNLSAIEAGQRFIDRDLNRIWTPEHLAELRNSGETQWKVEDREMAALIEAVHEAMQFHKPEVLILLDLHTTSADGGIFVIPSRQDPSYRLAKDLKAPVVLGLINGIDGSLLHFSEGNQFEINGYPKQSLGVAFEGGQHEDPASVDRCMAAILNTLRSAGCIPEDALAGHYDDLLSQYSQNLPKVTRLCYVHHVSQDDNFKMRPGYLNFQTIAEGEHLADDVNGPILAKCAGMILMPLYQSRGSDGFFIVEAVV